MTKIHVAVQPDFMKSLAAVRPLAALAEILWNGFDAANSTGVKVVLDVNKMGGLESLRIRDDGEGIPHAEIDTLFGNLGDSWKKAKVRQNGRALHGKNGKGRFKAFALGSFVEWHTTYEKSGKLYSYKITSNSNSLDSFDVTEPVEIKKAVTGTEVTIYNLHHDFDSLKEDYASQELAKTFAAYLTEYPNLSLNYNGTVVNPTSAQSNSENYELGEIVLDGRRKAVTELSIIEWNISTDRSIHLCDEKGISLHQIEAGVRAPGFNFTAYVKTSHFRELDKDNKLMLDELHPDVDDILKVARNKIKEHFRRRTLENQGQIIERWKTEHIYPYQEKAELGPVEEAERQVFDILAVNVNAYLPAFEDYDEKSKKFTFRLLAQAIRENPESIQRIVTEVLDLKKEQQDDLAALLEKTPLASIISSAKIIANRLDFLAGLEALIFNSENKRILLEREQLHPILKGEAWLFHEEFALAGSELKLEEVLNKHLDKLGKREDDIDPVTLPDGKAGRVDLMLHKAIQPRNGEYDYLIVELKRPSKKIDDEVITQIKKYAMAVASDERFKGVPTHWTFLAVSNELDKFAEKEANQRGKPKGMVYDDAEMNLTVWVKSWAEVINDAKSRLNFCNKQLAYNPDMDSAKAYLKTAHEKYIPTLDPHTKEPTAKSKIKVKKVKKDSKVNV